MLISICYNSTGLSTIYSLSASLLTTRAQNFRSNKSYMVHITSHSALELQEITMQHWLLYIQIHWSQPHCKLTDRKIPLAYKPTKLIAGFPWPTNLPNSLFAGFPWPKNLSNSMIAGFPGLYVLVERFAQVVQGRVSSAAAALVQRVVHLGFRVDLVLR